MAFQWLTVQDLTAARSIALPCEMTVEQPEQLLHLVPNEMLGLADALETAFPVLHRLLGAKFFRAMSVVYLRQDPPTTPLLMHSCAMQAVLPGESLGSSIAAGGGSCDFARLLGLLLAQPAIIAIV